MDYEKTDSTGQEQPEKKAPEAEKSPLEIENQNKQAKKPEKVSPLEDYLRNIIRGYLWNQFDASVVETLTIGLANMIVRAWPVPDGTGEFVDIDIKGETLKSQIENRLRHYSPPALADPAQREDLIQKQLTMIMNLVDLHIRQLHLQLMSKSEPQAQEIKVGQSVRQAVHEIIYECVREGRKLHLTGSVLWDTLYPQVDRLLKLFETPRIPGDATNVKRFDEHMRNHGLVWVDFEDPITKERKRIHGRPGDMIELPGGLKVILGAGLGPDVSPPDQVKSPPDQVKNIGPIYLRLEKIVRRYASLFKHFNTEAWISEVSGKIADVFNEIRPKDEDDKNIEMLSKLMQDRWFDSLVAKDRLPWEELHEIVRTCIRSARKLPPDKPDQYIIDPYDVRVKLADQLTSQTVFALADHLNKVVKDLNKVKEDVVDQVKSVTTDPTSTHARLEKIIRKCVFSKYRYHDAEALITETTRDVMHLINETDYAKTQQSVGQVGRNVIPPGSVVVNTTPGGRFGGDLEATSEAPNKDQYHRLYKTIERILNVFFDTEGRYPKRLSSEICKELCTSLANTTIKLTATKSAVEEMGMGKITYPHQLENDNLYSSGESIRHHKMPDPNELPKKDSLTKQVKLILAKVLEEVWQVGVHERERMIDDATHALIQTMDVHLNKEMTKTAEGLTAKLDNLMTSLRDSEKFPKKLPKKQELTYDTSLHMASSCNFDHADIMRFYDDVWPHGVQMLSILPPGILGTVPPPHEERDTAGDRYLVDITEAFILAFESWLREQKKKKPFCMFCGRTDLELHPWCMYEACDPCIEKQVGKQGVGKSGTNSDNQTIKHAFANFAPGQKVSEIFVFPLMNLMVLTTVKGEEYRLSDISLDRVNKQITLDQLPDTLKGVAGPGRQTGGGNYGLIFQKNADGMYECVKGGDASYKGKKFTAEDMLSDYNKGFLVAHYGYKADEKW